MVFAPVGFIPKRRLRLFVSPPAPGYWNDVCPTVRSVCQGCRRHRVAAAAFTHGQVGLCSHHPGQVGLDTMSHVIAMFYDRANLLLRCDNLLRTHCRRVGALAGNIMS